MLQSIGPIPRGMPRAFFHLCVCDFGVLPHTLLGHQLAAVVFLYWLFCLRFKQGGMGNPHAYGSMLATREPCDEEFGYVALRR